MAKDTLRALVLMTAIGLQAPLAYAVCGDGAVEPGEQCDLGVDNGAATSCCTTLCEFRAGGLTCRTSAGPCDVIEACTGSSDACPADGFQPSNFQCRVAAGACDLPETCSGSGPACPADSFRPAGTVCRAPAGSCDVTEDCDGTGPACPADVVVTAGTVCRPATGDCDLTESCDGANPACPADVVKAPGTECRAGNGTCDPAETCDGSDVACPEDAFAPDDLPCSDGSACTDNDICFRGVCVGTANVDACLDDFLCYKTKASIGQPFFTPISGVHLVDTFEDVNVDVTKPRSLCLPANKEAEGVVDPATHLKAYAIRTSSGFPRHVPQQNILVTNQLGFIRVDTTGYDLLLVPAAKDLVSQPPAPDPETHGVDHYKCHRVRVTAGTPRFPERVTVGMTDQFNLATKTLKLVKPRHLCTAVDKNGEGVKHPTVHLMCYIAKGSPRTARRTGVFVTDQFGPSKIDTIREKEFCVPSEITVTP